MRRTIIKNLRLLLAAISIAAVICVGLIFEPAVKLFGYATLDTNRLDNIKNSLEIFDLDGEEISGAKYCSLSKLNSYTIDAFLCAEDKRFFSHEGVDYCRIISAAIKNISDGRFSQGASTITQQLIKNTHLSNEKSISRKIQEIRLSRAIERKYTKNEILEMYLNILYFGNGAYGISTAAQSFFGKSPSALNLKESVALATIINNPTVFNPYKNPENLNKRINLILKIMKNNGKISQEQHDNAIKDQIALKSPSLLDKYRYFVISQAKEILGCTEEYLYSSGARIYCNVNKNLQTAISKLLDGISVEKAQIIVIDNKSGKIIAHEAKYNGDPSKIRRSPGSTIKPIVCFAPAIEKGIIVPITPILDEKTSFGSYCPSNYKNEYHGWVSCEYALKNSLNIPAVKLLDYVGLEYAKKFANNLGIKTSSDEGLALALGGMTSGTSLKEIASVYSTFARSGLSKESSYINSIFINNKLVYSNPIISHRVMKEETAYLINEMLCECVQSGTAKTIKSLPNVWAAKTGTVGKGNNNTDAYCIAYSTDYTIGVHIFDAPTVTGGNLPAKLANKLIMSDIISTTMFKIPNSILKIDIDGIEYNNNHKVIVAKKSLPQKDKITASFPTFNLPMHPDERSDYEKSLDFFDMNNFTIVDSFFD